MSDVQNRLDALSPEQRALFERKLRERQRQPPAPGAPGVPPSSRRVRGGPIPLSFAQERFWFLHQMEHGRGAYNTFIVVKLEGALDVGALEASFREILRRHDVLRTAFDDSNGRLVAVLDPAATVDLTIVDLRAAGDGAARARPLVEAEIQRRFDLRRAELLRPVLYRLTDEDQWLAVTLHHIASDRWSTTVLIRELAALYASFSAHEPSRLAELPMQYADFAAWQREWFESDDCRHQLEYWRHVLGDGVAPLQLPCDRPRGPIRRFRGATVSALLPRDLLMRVVALGQQEGATPFMTALTAYAILLFRYSGQTDFAIGSPVANRRGAETHRLIGCFVNTLALRCRPTADLTGRALLRQVRATCLGAYTHQDLPFERLVDDLDPPRGVGHSPFFQVMFTLNDQHDPASGHAVLATTLTASGLRLTPLDFEAGHVPTDLLLHVDPRPDGLNCRYDYDTDLFDQTTATRMLARFGALLDAITTLPDRAIGDLPVQSSSERQAALDLGRGRRAGYPRSSVHAAFAAQARATPDRIAVSVSRVQLTYGDLARRARRLARALKQRGVGAEAPVALLLDRSIELIVSMLAVLEAGGAYVPIDPSYPESRIAFMLRDAGVRTVLAQAPLVARLSAFDGDVLCVDDEVSRAVERDDEWRGPEVAPDDLAYVMYTSGSTGEPKGAQIPHRGILRLVHGADYVDLGPDECLLQLASTAFDAATFEIWGALLHGARLALSPERVLTPRALGDLLAAEGVTILWLTASLFNTVIDDCPDALRGLRQLLIGGEALSMPHVRRAPSLLPGTQIINGYGPTETTTFACCYRIPRTLPDALAAMPIGLPISNSSAYVLDERLEPMPVGIPGALCLGGDGLARGYLCRPALTAETFAPDPFSDVPGARLYRTGDIARVCAAGVIEFLGRRDGQLKVRGFRIEAGEVEAALLSHPPIQEAAVVLRDVGPDDRRLVAYVVARKGDEVLVDDLRRVLRDRLPEFEVPSLIIPLPALPRTSTGKLDRRALPAPCDLAPIASGAGVPPRTPLEELLLAIWQDVLEIDRPGAHDSFFDCGGHSLLATRIVSRVRDACGVSVPLRSFFERPTVAGLAQTIERLRTPDRVEAPPLVRCTSDGEAPSSFAQQRLWFLEQLDPGSSTYVIPVAARLRGALDADALRRSLDAIVRRHAALRTTFHSRDGQPITIVQPPSDLCLPIDDLTGIADADREAEVRAQATAEARRPFRLDEAPLLRARLLRLGGAHHVLLMALHHIAADGWSVAVLLRELAAGYEAAIAGRDAALPDLPVQYGDYAAWQRAWLQGETLDRQIAYWRTQLQGAETTLRLPIDRPRSTATGAGARERFRLSRELTAALSTVSRQQSVTLFMTLLAAFQTLLARYTGQTDITIGTPIAGRVRQEVEPLIGFFVNTLALRCDLSGNPRFSDLLTQVRDVTLDAYTHQDVPFERVIEALHPARDLSQSPLFQVMLAFHNTPPVRVSLPTLRITDLAWESGRAKFDLTLELAEVTNGIVAAIEYRADLFSAPLIRRVIRHFQSLLGAVALHPSARLRDLPLVTDVAQRSLVVRRRRKGRSVEPLALHEWIERQAVRTPHRPAIVCDSERVSYATLDRRANALAWRLREAGVAPEARIGICLDRSAALVTVLLAVLKAGAAYMLLDAASATDHLALAIDAAQIDAIVTVKRWREVAASAAVRVICLDEREQDARDEDQCAEGPRVTRLPEALAGVLCASVSSAPPSAIGITHGNAGASLSWVRSIVGQRDLSAALVSTSMASAQFPVELFASLSVGGTVVLVDDLSALAERPAAAAVSFIHTTSPAMRELLHRGTLPESVRTVLLTSELLTADLVAQLYAQPGVQRVFTRYGPAETSSCGTCALLPREACDTRTIGRPVASAQVHVLDARMEPAPSPVLGELYVGGAGLARGYRDAARTAERFVPSPFGDGARLYRTGDLARYRPDGSLEIVDRRGDRASGRGFVAALSEAHVLDHPAVSEAAVVVRDETGPRRLVAYIVLRPGQEATPGEIRRLLHERVPSHMIPSAIVRVPRLPRLPNGAIDRQALPSIDEPNATRGGPARTPLEHALAAIWRELLRVEAVGRETDFFDAGGHSLLATQFVARVRRDWHVDLPLKTVFQTPTIAGLAERIAIVRWAADGPPSADAPGQYEELSL